jgi:hypothetical protein
MHRYTYYKSTLYINDAFQILSTFPKKKKKYSGGLKVGPVGKPLTVFTFSTFLDLSTNLGGMLHLISSPCSE